MKLRLSKPISIALWAGVGILLSCAIFALVVVLGASHPEPQTNTSALRNPLDGVIDGVSSLFRADPSTDEYFAANHFPTLIGAKGDGVSNDTDELQKSLEHAGETGGTVYLPQGIYRITEPLTIPSGVTLRGDFSSPNSKDTDGRKTVLLVADNGKTRSAPLLTLEDNASLTGITVYYEGQAPGNAVEYPATVLCKANARVEKISLLNPYHGICVTGTGAVDLRSVWISPLDYGILVTENNNLVTVEDCFISPTYWLNYAPTVFSDGAGYSSLTSYLHETMHGIILEKVTDVTLNRVFVEDGAVGILLNVPKEQQGVILIKETTVSSVSQPLHLLSIPQSGVLVADSTFRPENDSGADTVQISPQTEGPVLFSNCTFSGLPKRVVNGENHSFVSFYHCNFGTWWDVCFNFSADTFLAVAPTFKTQNEKATLGKDAFGLFYNSPALEETSQLLFSVPQGDALRTESVAVVSSKETVKTFVSAPILNALEYGISPEAEDNAPAMNQLLQRAKEQKATVFLPEGIYKFNAILTVPEGVRLVGVGCSGNYRTVLNFNLQQNTDYSLLELGQDSSVENLELRQGSILADSHQTYAISTLHSAVRIRNAIISAGRGIWLAGGENASIEQVTLNVTQVGILLQTAKNVHLRDLTITDPSGSYGTTGIRLENATATLTDCQGVNLACGLELNGETDLEATLVTLRGPTVGIKASHSGKLVLTASGFSEAGQGGQTVVFQGTEAMNGTATMQGMVVAGTSLQGNLISAKKGTTELRAALITAPFTNTVISDGEGKIALYGCIWDNIPTSHATVLGGTVTFAANLLRSDKLFEGIEGDYMLTVTGEESGTVNDDVNIIQHIYQDIETEVAPENQGE